MTALARLSLALALLSLAGCADAMTVYWKSVSTTAIAHDECRDILSAVHEQKTAAVKTRAQSGYPAEAQADLDRWLPSYAKGKTVCAALKAAAKEGVAAAPVIEAAVNKKTQVAGWVARLAKLAIDTAAVLAELGIKMPEVK